jgi:endonuclease-3
MQKPEDLKNISIEKIQESIKTLWFFRSKAKYVKGLWEILSKSKKIPETIEELIKLPWVWIKTSKVFLAEIHWKPVLAVDTHVHRVLNRLWFVNTKLAEETDKVAEKIFKDDDKIRLHHSLIFFGRYNCKAKKPECESCIFLKWCKFGKNFFKEKK